jgi:hypothetical protein
MSEYQYYEFRAIDRALNDRQMRAGRSRRVQRSAHVVQQRLHVGDLKANPRDLLTSHFDASYFANWLSWKLRSDTRRAPT